MFKEKSTDEIINLINEVTKDKNIENISISLSDKQKDYTLKDLQQRLINYLYVKEYYDKNEIELAKILFENNDI